MSNSTARTATTRKTDPKGTTAMTRATSTATTRVRKAVAKATTPTEDKAQAQRERAAAGTKHIAELAVEEYRKALVNELAHTRIIAAESKAARAMRAANASAKLAGVAAPFRAVVGTLNSIQKDVTKDNVEKTKAAIRRNNEQPTPATVPATKAASKPAAQRKSSPKVIVVEVKAPAKKAAPKVALHEVETVNRADGSVDGHRAGCADIAKVVKRERLDHFGEPFAVASKHQAWLEYNVDFLPECEGCEGHDEAAGNCQHAYDINWLACAKAIPSGIAPEPEVKPVAPRRTAKKVAPRPVVKKATAAERKAEAGKRTAAAVPAKKVASKAATVAGSSALDKGTAPKAFALADYLTAAGWDTEVTKVDSATVKVVGKREGETLTVNFIDGKLPAHAERTYERTDGSIVKMRNVSAVRQQADKDPAKRPVKTVRTVVVRTRSTTPEVEAEESGRALDIDVKNADVDDLQKYLADTTIWWRRSAANGGGVSEARVWKVTKLIDTPSGRAMEFVEAASTKRGWTAGPVRCVVLKNVRRG